MTADRARGALLGLAVGDALGHPADAHRSIRHPWPRGAVRSGTAALDAQRVSRPLLPFAPTLDGTRGLVATDDAETAAAAALALLASPEDHRVEALLPHWTAQHVRDDAWMGIAARSAERNLALGLVPPATGDDNPARDDDTALPAAVAIGIAAAGDPDRAGRIAAGYASITNSGDGVAAAVIVARAIAALVGGAELPGVVAEALDGPREGRLAAALEDARDLVTWDAAPFAVLPELIERLVPRNYSYSNAAAVTLPVALVVVGLAGGDPGRAIPLALSVSRAADGMPAIVGALCGASSGTGALDAYRSLAALEGILLPGTAGVDLLATADALLRLSRRAGA
ncbi:MULTISPECIES: ADP-ribosylglycohydrolase family protein [unclassified Rathayibacter]|uniref:ADP-ribosylglycohydrolase family protein n=1 Tax=unclassified Rathayibacter TaxID=2609250 RepID=UPI0006F67E5F|nr:MULTISPECIES: ADP-ribosylglycohydrolase family protein [unclassified Rathayibacter]KQQ03815.1 hypothetical protein ASF42_10145 [Rathayibacter sp. Leaf294]KQS12272.1 hypothetical protein ASG06_10145 [Rathayibacter sp. Leaf185]